MHTHQTITINSKLKDNLKLKTRQFLKIIKSNKQKFCRHLLKYHDTSMARMIVSKHIHVNQKLKVILIIWEVVVKFSTFLLTQDQRIT